MWSTFRSWSIAFCLLPLVTPALTLDDFTPGFLSSDKSHESANTDPKLAFSVPDSVKKRNASGGGVWYCNKINALNCARQNSSSTVPQNLKPETAALPTSSVTATGGNGQYFNRNQNSYDQNAINNFNITDSNQSTLQAYAPQLNNKSMEATLKDSVAIPLKANNNTDVSVGTNQIKFNVTY